MLLHIRSSHCHLSFICIICLYSLACFMFFKNQMMNEWMISSQVAHPVRIVRQSYIFSWMFTFFCNVQFSSFVTALSRFYEAYYRYIAVNIPSVEGILVTCSVLVICLDTQQKIWTVFSMHIHGLCHTSEFWLLPWLYWPYSGSWCCLLQSYISTICHRNWPVPHLQQ